jgi:tetratricopeptide (TPR) repeat protein
VSADSAAEGTTFLLVRQSVRRPAADLLLSAGGRSSRWRAFIGHRQRRHYPNDCPRPVRRRESLGAGLAVGDNGFVIAGTPVGSFELVGRERETRELKRFVEQLPDGERFALVRGEPGFGKTTIWRDVVAAAEAAGIRVLAIRCAQVEMPLALGGLCDLLEGAFDEIADELARPQSGAIAAALGVEDPPLAASDGLVLPRAVVAGLRLLATRAPLLVAIDDVQWLDAGSRRVLAFALRRLGGLPFGVLATLRGGAGVPDPLDLAEAIDRGSFVELEVGGLSPGALQHLVRSRLAVRLPRPTSRRLHVASGGNPMFALEFAHLLAEREPVPGAEPLPIPPSLRELVRVRVARFPDEIRPLLDLVATLERPTRHVMTSAFGDGAADQLLADAERAEAVALGTDGVVRFTHPLLAATVYADATPERRRALHAQAADLMTDLEARAGHLALAAAGPDHAVAAVLDEAGQRASARGSPDAAAEFAERAWLLTPSSLSAERTRRALVLARYLMDAAQVSRAIATLDQLLAGAVMGLDRAEALQLRATDEQDGIVAIALLENALEHSAEDRAVRARILGHLAYGIAFWLGDPRSGELRAREAVALAEELGDPFVLDSTLRTLAEIAALRGRPYADLLERAMALAADPHESSAGSSRSVMGLLCCWSGDLARARELLEEELEPATRHGEKRRAFVLLRLAEAEWRAGDLDAAERNTAEPAEIFLDGGDPWGSAQVLTTQAVLAAVRGREAESRRLVNEAISRESDHGIKHQAIANRWVLGFLELSLDQPERAYELLGSLPDELEALGVGEPGLIPVVPDVVEALVALGRLEVAETMVRRFEEQAAALQHRWAIPAAHRCRALILLGRGEAQAALVSAEEAVAGFALVGFPLDRGRSLLVAGDALRRLGERRRAADKFREAATVFSRLGAALWLERAGRELRRANPRPRKDRALTGSESRVAVLVASGLTNKEVAGQLFTTVSTVKRISRGSTGRQGSARGPSSRVASPPASFTSTTASTVWVSHDAERMPRP